jgi:hypothetical protein
MHYVRHAGRLAGIVVLAIVTAAAVGGCKKQNPAETAAQSKPIDMESLSAAMGRADGANSGLADFVRSGDSLRLTYHLYVPQGSDFDDYIGADMAPKIKKLYDDFKRIDKVTFVVETADSAMPADWKPYCSFSMTREVAEKTNWTGLLGRDLFKVCKEITYSR